MSHENLPVIPKLMIDANPLPDWTDPRVQLVYKMLCDPDLDTPPNREEHWEGWVARNIVAALSAYRTLVRSSNRRDGMTKFRKKPVVIDAVQYDGKNLEEILAFVGKLKTGGGCRIETLEGTMEALPGDWIIRGVKGEFYPCKPDIFEKTYEPA